MKKLIALLLALVMVIGLVACGTTAPETPEETEAAPQQTEAATQAPTEELENNDEPVNTNPTYTVKVVDEGGNPVAGAMVQICQGESCLPGVLGADGTAIFQVAEADYKVSFLGGVPAGYEYTTEETEFYFDNYEVTIVLKAVA